MSLRIYFAAMIACTASLGSTKIYSETGHSAEPTTIKTNHSDSLIDNVVDELELSNGDCPPDVIRSNLSVTCFAHNVNVRLIPDEPDASDGALVNLTDGSISVAGADVTRVFDGESAPYWFGAHAPADFLVADTTAQLRFGENVASVTFQLQPANVGDANVIQILILDDAGGLLGSAEASIDARDAADSRPIGFTFHAKRVFRSIIFQNTLPLLIGNLRYQPSS